MTNSNFSGMTRKNFISIVMTKYNGTFLIELEHECIICVSGKNSTTFFCMNRRISCCSCYSNRRFCWQNIEKLLKCCLLAKLKLCGIIGAEAKQQKRSSITTMKSIFLRFLSTQRTVTSNAWWEPVMLKDFRFNLE